MVAPFDGLESWTCPMVVVDFKVKLHVLDQAPQLPLLSPALTFHVIVSSVPSATIKEVLLLIVSSATCPCEL
jgi:hypothetical protein